MNLREMWDIFKHSNMCMVRVPKEKERENEQKIVGKRMIKNFQNLRIHEFIHPKSSMNSE